MVGVAAAWIVVLAGCVDNDEDATDPSGLGLAAYLVDYPGAENWAPGTEHGWLLRISNPTNSTLQAVVAPLGVSDAPYFYAHEKQGAMPDIVTPDGPDGVGGLRTTLEPGEAALVVMQVRAYANETVPWGGFRVHTMDGDTRVATADIERQVTVMEGRSVTAGDHVQTATIGMWVNGTSFYTNIAALNDDPEFPAGYNRSEFGGDPLPIYVYQNDRSEQPAGSRDTCHFTTIRGYNDLLLQQGEHGTSARFLEPEEAYTRDGAEDHPLYGDAMVFLNTIVSHDGATTVEDRAPNPGGACYDPRNVIPAGTLPPI